MMSMTILGVVTGNRAAGDRSGEGDGALYTGWVTSFFTGGFPSCWTPFRKGTIPLLNRVPKKRRLDLVELAACHLELSASLEGASGNEETERDIIVGCGGRVGLGSKSEESGEVNVFRTNERLTEVIPE
jgi:hypothetical protein